ncbi:PhzF family phenazine biosynthesis protein [Flavobacteriaceae bacterium]|nr:PhzF family phenazine biosynthesis protein [Flavobacteriaceae bacterium]
MEYDYYICDVFTDTAFGGNQLAVLPDARGLTDKQMQQIAREFNYSESTFVFPAKNGNTRNVKIFTPTREVPFAGHPNIGTAFVLASMGVIGDSEHIIFEEKAGLVEISINNQLYCELKAPEKFSLGTTLDVELIAHALSLNTHEIITKTHAPQIASVGLPFIMVELNSLETLQLAKPNLDGFQAIADLGIMPDIHMYLKSNDAFDLRTRMFAPLDGVPEDPATGSANCALTALLTHFNEQESGEFNYKIAQGIEMGRPSILYSRAEKRNGEIIKTWIGGNAVITCKGTIYIP